MASDEEYILYDVSPSAAALRAEIVRHDGGGAGIRHDGGGCGGVREHSDEAESSQKQYSAGDGRDDYSEEQDFCTGSLAGDDRMQGKSLEILHGSKVLEGIGFAMQGPSGLLMGMNNGAAGGGAGGGGIRMHRSKSKRRDREETSDGGTYYKKGKSSSGGLGRGEGDGGSKKDREEWSDGAISCLLDAYTEKYLQLNRGNLRGSDWEEVANVVSDRLDGQKPAKTVDQCKNKVDSLKKRYKTEKNRSNGSTVSYWPWFKKVDQIVGTGPKLSVLSDDERERASACNNGNAPANHHSKQQQLPSPLLNATSIGNNNITIVANHGNSTTPVSASKRSQQTVSAPVGLLTTPKKMSSRRWKRVLLKISGKCLAGNHSQNVDPEIVSLISREVAATVSQLDVEVAIVVGGGNFFHGPSWVARGGLDRTSADHIGMMATVMNAIFLQASLESVGVETRVQTAFKLEEIAEPYIRRRAIRHLEKGRVVLFGAGIGNSYFSTDTAAALRAAEINAEVVLKATNVDGIYDSDPKINPGAVLLEHLSYRDAAVKELTMIDITAVSFCQEYAIPVVIFNLHEPGNISRALCGERIGTIIDQTGPLYQ